MIRTLLAGFAFAIALTAQAQSDLASYAGADRMERLAAAAKKEGGFTLYTSFAEKDLPTLIPPFEKKYGVKVKVWRASTVNVLQRVITEARAGRHDVDVVLMSAPEMEALLEQRFGSWKARAVPAIAMAARGDAPYFTCAFTEAGARSESGCDAVTTWPM